MFAYPEILRIQSELIQRRSDKQYAIKGNVDDFFRGREVVVEEKLDGSQAAVSWKNGKPFLQGKNSHISDFDKRPQYAGFVQWAYENSAKLELLHGYLVFGEWLKIRHYIPYDKLPDWFIAFDVYDGKRKKFLNLREKTEFLKSVGLAQSPILYSGQVTMKLIESLTIGKPSAFSDSHMEGCIIKDYREQTMVKFVVHEFIDGIDEDGHWMRHDAKLNKIGVKT